MAPIKMPYYHRCRHLHLSLITAWMVFFSFLVSITWHLFFFQTQACKKCGFLWAQETCPLSVCPSEMSCLGISAVFLHRSLLPWLIQFQVTFLDAVPDYFEWKWFSKTLQSLCGYCDHGGLMVSHAVLPDSSKVIHLSNPNFYFFIFVLVSVR